MSLWLTKGFDSQEDDLLPSYVRTAYLDLGDFTFFIHLARIQAIASVFNLILTIVSGAFGELSTTTGVHLLRTLALLVIAIVTLRYSPGSPVLKPTSALGSPLAIVVLQAGWIVSELAFPRSVFAPVALSTQPVFPRTHQEILILRFGPVSLILLMASCLGFFSKALKRRRRSQSGNCSESTVCEPVIVVQRQGVAKSQLPSECHMDTVDTVDTVDSASSISDGIDVRSRASSSTELFVSGASTPCGHCPPSPKNVVKLVEPGSAVETFELSDDTIYLTQHVLDTNETVLFVYKRLKPIKTRVEDPPPPPPIPPPSYSYPANYVSNPLKQDCNGRHYGSTTKIVRPYGMDMEGAVMIPRGQRIIPIVATIPL